MLKLYTWKTPNGYKVPILLAELKETNAAIDYELIPINISKGDQMTPEFLAINPNNKIPALIDEDAAGGSLTIFESGAILEYLAEKHGKFFPKDTQGKYEVLEWLLFQMASVGPMFGQLGHFVRFAPEKIPYAITRYTDEVKRIMGVMEKRLEVSNYLAGEYSIADIAAWPWLRALKSMEILPFTDYPNVSRWFSDIENRPAVQLAIEKVDAECI